ncbi:MarR family winged helix-turn-helix transcriptional regulator [Amycolatopsis sp. FDAARGOS 1241]|uniref:MarR family winged helix-turn-helix transcriptional regulator n=1 Tax=Amycolatopsis sp. FDAARGOS 1241 TaxID=2778070 RepID=UPI0019501AE7|nr:MarR family winged helix-turn-helix transcriptional regulator [Amycolatopsis sp. FDAARGOS 1241]QRP49940.1 winged helix-turn-helix transcriptional regulator [Amycolatopsis sp. FDAARGOS 1241]
MRNPGDNRVPTLLHSRPSWLVTQLATQVARVLTDAISTAEFRRDRYPPLAAVEEFGPASQAALGRRCRIDRSYVVEAVTELADAGLVLREADPADRRRNVITLTAEGRTKPAELREVLDRVRNEITAPLTARTCADVTAVARPASPAEPDYRLSGKIGRVDTVFGPTTRVMHAMEQL